MCARFCPAFTCCCSICFLCASTVIFSCVYRIYHIKQISDMSGIVTGGSCFGIVYKDGVLIAADTLGSYGSNNRYKGVSRIYRVSDKCLIAFSGDVADFQYLKNVIERKVISYQYEMCDPEAQPSARAVHAWLTAVLYYQRCRMDPYWNTLMVAGSVANADGDPEPFLATVDLRGVAVEHRYVGTGMGAMLLRQALEDAFRAKSQGSKTTTEMTREEATALMTHAIELLYYKHTMAHNEYQLAAVGKEGGAEILPSAVVIGKWADQAQHVRGYE